MFEGLASHSQKLLITPFRILHSQESFLKNEKKSILFSTFPNIAV